MSFVAETQLQYNAMQVGPVELLFAKQQQIEAGAAYVRSLRDYWSARAQLDLILSGRLGAGVSAPSGSSDSSGGSTAPDRGGH